MKILIKEGETKKRKKNNIEKDQKRKKTFVKNKFECRWGLVVDVVKKEREM